MLTNLSMFLKLPRRAKKLNIKTMKGIQACSKVFIRVANRVYTWKLKEPTWAQIQPVITLMTLRWYRKMGPRRAHLKSSKVTTVVHLGPLKTSIEPKLVKQRSEWVRHPALAFNNLWQPLWNIRILTKRSATEQIARTSPVQIWMHQPWIGILT